LVFVCSPLPSPVPAPAPATALPHGRCVQEAPGRHGRARNGRAQASRP
jgi:hypothetical protein